MMPDVLRTSYPYWVAPAAAPATARDSQRPATHGDRLILVIGAFKLVKAGLLVVLAVAGLAGPLWQWVHAAEQAVTWTGMFVGRDTLRRALGELSSLDPATVKKLGILSLCYAAVFLTESVGLLRKKRWAEWLTVLVTTSFIPIEIYELVGHPGPTKVAALISNVAIAIYLAWRRFQGRSENRAA